MLTEEEEDAEPVRSGSALQGSWRERVALEQERAVPDGSCLVTCPAPLGAGGLGRHAEEIVQALARRGQPAEYIGKHPQPRLPLGPISLRAPSLSGTALALARFSPGWRMWMTNAAFDAQAARDRRRTRHLIAFNGAAQSQFRTARAERGVTLHLVSATAHFRTVARQHARAYAQYPLERSWADHLLARNLAEYRQADRILVSSERVWHSFVDAGVDHQSLVRFPLTPDARFSLREPSSEAGPSYADTFDIVYVGGLTVVKGVPLLIDAIRRLEHRDLRLVLVGGWGTRGMRRFIAGECARDRRIEVRLGDPRQHLRAARLYVHASYDDGYGYAPAEALAAGVPVIVSHDTGMKDLVEDGVNGAVVPTGDCEPLTEAIDAAYRGELLRG
jgi:glycosyltransferase involved in cell wall biosynthesis